MKLQLLLLVFGVVIATVSNVYCEAQLQLGGSDKSPVNKGHTLMSRQKGRSCCIEKRNGQKQNCPCAQPLQHTVLNQKQKDLCKKKKIWTYKKCEQLIFQGNKKKGKSISTPF